MYQHKKATCINPDKEVMNSNLRLLSLIDNALLKFERLLDFSLKTILIPRIISYSIYACI